MEIETIDLTGICRHPERCRTTVTITNAYGGDHKVFLRLGQAELFQQEHHTVRRWWLNARLGPEGPGRGVPTDFEEDSAYACQLPLIGVVIESTRYFHVSASGWIDPGAIDDLDPKHSDFHVPRAGYDPRKHPDATQCEREECVKHGDGPHTIVPEDFYVPPFDPELYELVRGRRVDISIDFARDMR